MEKKFYLCKVCGNVVLKVVDSGVTPFCCGQEMTELVPKTTDIAAEKHAPVVTMMDKTTIKVEIGSVLHPMTQEHHICFIFLETICGVQIKWLKPEESPVAFFTCGKDEFVSAYAFCNIHGLWKSEQLNE